ncbi:MULTISPECIES: hypothetical protein [unclassified Modicisalibacter]|uniref:hypothetical protein n=1 Tax=unclassified Modicisalibacter TaxID=2679913 RepID=UPI001CD02428|nr:MULTISPECIES: hypothetical protein [unclassified Modicisalibacter]MBZ9556914.1 hypothetical protein [Modicisalibacter sp. R2A 31.J]MBZ9574373.1 hypothetical protein [Modicisalibacter sp. MOD 31.J]
MGLDLEAVNADRTRAPAEALTNFGDDIAVIRVEAEGRLTCHSNWPRPDSLEERLHTAVAQGHKGVVLRIRETGGIESLPVRFTALDDRHIEAAPLILDREGFKGISGSQLLLDGRLVGIVLELTGKGRFIRAYRKDALDQRINGFFAVGPPRMPTTALPVEIQHGHVMTTARTAVRQQPTPWSPVVRWLEVGESIELRGKVSGRPWWQTTEGYVRVRNTTPPDG